MKNEEQLVEVIVALEGIDAALPTQDEAAKAPEPQPVAVLENGKPAPPRAFFLRTPR